MAALSAPVLASPILYATSGSQLYRIDVGNLDNGGLPQGVDMFQMEHTLVSLTHGNNGELWGTERYESSGDSKFSLYRIDDLMSTPIMTEHADFIGGRTSTIVNVNGNLQGFLDDTSEMISIDTVNNTYDVIGSYANLPNTPASSGFDSLSQTSYGIRDNELFQFDSNFGTSGSFNSVKVADLDFNGINGPMGGEIVDGVYYHAVVQDLVMHIFSVDLITGATDELVSFDVLEGDAVGLAGIPAVPAPGSAALLALGSLIATRRRRSE